ncbi:MAG TPA: hypothetical protein VH278_04615 [Burkholderiaceae bacterium]|nr:hypothetical protein [Burkholderiaceae bacterium]
MSVLNTMLRDLERRGERLPLSLTPQPPTQQEAKPQAAAAPAAPPLRATTFEPQNRRRPVRPAVLLVALAAAGAATWLWLHPAKPPVAAMANSPVAVAAPPPTEPVATVAQAQSATPAAADVPLQAPLPTQASAPMPAEAASPPAPAQPMHPPSFALQATEGKHTPTPPLAAGTGAPAAKPVTGTPSDAPSFAPGAAAPGASEAKPSVAQSVAPSELARAMQLIARGRNTEATEALTAALSQRPAWNEARSTLAALQAEAGDRQQALLTLLDGVPFEPRRFAPMAAQLQAELNDPSGALQTLDQVPADARDQTYHGLAAAVAQRAGRHDLAVAEYGEALRLAPGNSVSWLGLGVSLQALGRDADALTAYRSAAAGTLGTDLRNFTQARINTLQGSVAAAPAVR